MIEIDFSGHIIGKFNDFLMFYSPVSVINFLRLTRNYTLSARETIFKFEENVALAAIPRYSAFCWALEKNSFGTHGIESKELIRKSSK